MNNALILIDLQNDYFPGGRMELVGTDLAAANACRLLEHYRRKKQRIIHVQHISAGPDAGFFVRGTSGVEIHDRVAPRPGEALIVKHSPNSFRDTNLYALLKTEEIKSLTICGAMSHMCIDASTRAAFDLGFDCTLIADACATRDLAFGQQKVPAAQVHAAFMAALSAVYARVIDTLDFLAQASQQD